MVLILSAPDDSSTNDVIDWLIFLDKKFIRISEEDIIQFSNIEISNEDVDFTLLINNEIEIKLSEISKFWYRRSYIKLFVEKIREDIELYLELNYHLRNESQIILNSFLNEVKNKSLNSPHDNSLNKITVLREATKIGLNIPKTLITNNKEKLINFHRKNKKLITKNISPGVFINNSEKYLSVTTQRVSTEEKVILTFFDKSQGLRKFVLRNIKPQPRVPSTEQRYDRIRNNSLFTSGKKRI